MPTEGYGETRGCGMARVLCYPPSLWQHLEHPMSPRVLPSTHSLGVPRGLFQEGAPLGDAQRTAGERGWGLLPTPRCHAKALSVPGLIHLSMSLWQGERGGLGGGVLVLGPWRVTWDRSCPLSSPPLSLSPGPDAVLSLAGRRRCTEHHWVSVAGPPPWKRGGLCRWPRG